MMLSDLAFHEEEAELFGSAIKFCCNYMKVKMVVVGNLSFTSEIVIDPKNYDYDDVQSLGKKVKELSKTHQAIFLLPSHTNDLCSNCGINI